MALRANEAEEQTLHVTTDPIEEEGFTLLASGGSKPLFDIVFIHGLQGHPESTWTYVENVQEDQVTPYDNQSRRTILGKALHLFRQDNSALTKEIRTFWPRDILPSDFPSARILTYGYASKISHFFGGDKPSHENLTENGKTFMNRLAAHRSQAAGRPLMLITHSLGGLIVKSVGISCRMRASANFARLFVSQQNTMTKTKTFGIFTTRHLPYCSLARRTEGVIGWAWVDSWRKLYLH